MLRSKIKYSIILSVVLLLVLYGSKLYRNITNDREIFHTDAFDYISAEASKIIVLNENYDKNKLAAYNPDFAHICELIDFEPIYPLIFLEYNENQFAFQMKAKTEQQKAIQHILSTRVAPYFEPTVRKYKGTDIYLATTGSDEFVAYTFKDGIFTISKYCKLIENFVDITKENTFFSEWNRENILSKNKTKSPITVYDKEKENLLALNYTNQGDSLLFEGYIFNSKNDSIGNEFVYTMILPDNLCISEAELYYENIIPEIKFSLNKIY